ncbi:unnamed protein product [Oppiella nova]|uniref:Uncharacterized protein n=1 Tax=Oppiella nova TaxID=334625 RepID=A0A7R9LL93_9ACAR|nr:unnamed protein product [Oppiella nova]CAG2164754.1 unnamed protein product [Oppiella nova]
MDSLCQCRFKLVYVDNDGVARNAIIFTAFVLKGHDSPLIQVQKSLTRTVDIFVDNKYINKTWGLLGVYDGNKENDLQDQQGKTYDDYNIENFVPNLIPPDISKASKQAQLLCGESLECLYDFITTGRTYDN